MSTHFVRSAHARMLFYCVCTVLFLFFFLNYSLSTETVHLWHIVVLDPNHFLSELSLYFLLQLYIRNLSVSIR